jgi:hypothetical protein
MPYSNFPGGFARALPCATCPSCRPPGQTFWVSNATGLSEGQRGGSDGNKGTFDPVRSTLNYAITQCVANRGDIIFIKPGHAESIASQPR